MSAKNRNVTLVAACLMMTLWAAATPAQIVSGDTPRTLKEAARLDGEIDIATRKAALDAIRNKDQPKVAAPTIMPAVPAIMPSGVGTMSAAHPYQAPVTPAPLPVPTTPEGQGIHLRATYGVGVDTTAILLRANGDFARMHRGDTFDNWRVDSIESGAVYLSRHRPATRLSRSKAHARIAPTSVAAGKRYRIEIDPPQQAGGISNIADMRSNGGPNRVYAEPLGSLPNPNRNVNQIVPMSTSTNMVPRPAGAGSGLVGGGVTPGDARTNAQLSNISNQVAPGLQPVQQPATFDPSTSLR